MLGMRRVEYTGNGPLKPHLDRRETPLRTFIPDPILGGAIDLADLGKFALSRTQKFPAL